MSSREAWATNRDLLSKQTNKTKKDLLIFLFAYTVSIIRYFLKYFIGAKLDCLGVSPPTTKATPSVSRALMSPY